MSEKEKNAKSNKDVIYIDADDEITGIIDKLRGSQHKIVALVLPKRAAALQSIVNMKLLKRTSDETKKNVVLITSEAGLLPLAGNVGMHVAKSLQSKPEIPEAPAKADDKPEAIDESLDGDPEEALDKQKSVGELAGVGAADELDDTIEMDDEDEDSTSEDGKDGKKVTPAGKGKNKKLKIPNFNKFRLLLGLGIVGVILLSGAAYAAFVVMPKAAVTIETDSSAVNSNAPITLNVTPDAKLDIDGGIVPAHKQEIKKTLSEQVPATGQQNNGAKATGSMKITNCSSSVLSLPAGTGFNANGKTFVSDAAVNVPKSSYSFTPGGFVCDNNGSATVAVTAQKGGSDYNLAAQTYVIANNPTNVTAKGSDMAGGTDDIIKVVTQADLDSASAKIGAQDTAPIRETLKNDLTNNDFYAVDVTFATSTPETKTSVKVGDTADSVTVTQAITYSMLGAKEDELKKIIANTVADKIDPSKQVILDHGLENAAFLLQEQKPEGMLVTMQTTVIAGPDLDVEAIKKQIAGKKSGDAEKVIKAYPGVTDVTVDYRPFWVGSIPKSTSKITITVEKPQAPAKTNDTQSP
jgi:hypothetical protein